LLVSFEHLLRLARNAEGEADRPFGKKDCRDAVRLKKLAAIYREMAAAEVIS